MIGHSLAQNERDKQFLKQHNIIRELANRYLRDEGHQFEKIRLNIETNGNDPPPPPECFPLRAQRVTSSCLASFNESILPRGVAAHILSITTGIISLLLQYLIERIRIRICEEN